MRYNAVRWLAKFCGPRWRSRLYRRWLKPLPIARRGQRTANRISTASGRPSTKPITIIEAHVARPALALRPGPYGPVPAAPVLALGAVGSVPPGMGVVEGGEIPYKPEALAKKKENQENWLTSDPEIKCYLPGVPRATYMPYPFQILQSASAIVIAYEYAGAVRNIFLRTPGPPPVDSWMGQSVGHWEGDTLVVDVKGMNDSDLVRSRRQFSQRRAARGGALHAHQPGCHFVRGDHRRSQSLHASLEDQHGALPAAGKERAAPGFQVRRICGRIIVRPVAEEAAGPLSRELVRNDRRGGAMGTRFVSLALALGSSGRAFGQTRACPTAIPIFKAPTIWPR